MGILLCRECVVLREGNRLTQRIAGSREVILLDDKSGSVPCEIANLICFVVLS